MTAGIPPSPEVVQQILTRVRNGETHAAVAADLGLGRHTVDRYARIHGITRRRRPDPPAPAPTWRRSELVWMERAACRDELGFTEWPVLQQVPVCNGCEVRADCLAFGLDNSVGWTKADEGPVYGGLSPSKLAALQRLQRRAS